MKNKKWLLGGTSLWVLFALLSCNSAEPPSGSSTGEPPPSSITQGNTTANPTIAKATQKTCNSDADCLVSETCVVDVQQCVALPPSDCQSDPDCALGEVCDPNSHQCVAAGPPISSNGVKDGDESDVDCGGSAPTKCPTGKACHVKTDCVPGNKCENDACVAEAAIPPDANGVKDGTESDVDCGGSNPTKCPAGKACNAEDDCLAADKCENNVCVTVAPLPQDSNGVRDGNETDIDCGGTNPNKCATGKSCNSPDDCATNKCENTVCVADTSTPIFVQQCPNGNCAQVQMMPPACKTLTPTDGTQLWSTGFSGTFAIKAKFNQMMDKNTINENTFTVAKTAGGAPVKGGVVVIGNNDVALFSQSKNLEPNTSYTATVKTGVKSSLGTPLNKECKWTFKTAGAVKSVYPDRDEDQVSTVAGQIRIEFENSLPPNTFSKNSLVLDPPVTIESVEQDSHSVTFWMSQKGDFETKKTKQFADDTTYTAILKKENFLASDYHWSFSTATCPDPVLDITWINRWCTWDNSDCEGNGCDPGFKNGAKVVTGGLYTMKWDTKHVTYVTEDCHAYQKYLKYNSDSGLLSWPWDGDTTGENSPYFKESLNRYFRGLFNFIEMAHAAGGNPTYSARHAGKFNCTIIYYGACGKNHDQPGKRKTKAYSYKCPI